MVVCRTVGNCPAVISALVHFAFVLAAPSLERAIEVLDRLSMHCLVLHGMTEVEPSLDARQQQVRLVGASVNSLPP